MSGTIKCDSCGRGVEVRGGGLSCPCGEGFETVRRISEAALESLGHRESLVLPKDLTDDPEEAGYRTSRLGKRKGQKRDYRLRASSLGRDEDGRELHLREYEDRYTLHWDAYPARSPMHAVKDAPDYGAAVATVVGVAAVAVGSGLVKRTKGGSHDEVEDTEMENVVLGGEPKHPEAENEVETTSRLAKLSKIGARVIGSLSGPAGVFGSLYRRLKGTTTPGREDE